MKADQRQFEAQLAEHQGIVYKIANSYCREREERDDLVQEICLQLWRSYPGYDPARRFSTWMYRVALNTAITFARGRRARETHLVAMTDYAVAESVEMAPPDQPDDRAVQLYRFLHAIPELDRALVVLYLEERSYREIAEVLGITETNVGTKLDRLKQKIRRDFGASKEIQHGAR